MDATAGPFGAWAPIGAEQTASGYDVGWKITGADPYTVWATESGGTTSQISSTLCRELSWNRSNPFSTKT
jgi:hypothetical protein